MAKEENKSKEEMKMDLSSLKPAKGATSKKIRVGRGVGSGRGRTSTRGHNGALSRSGSKKMFNFEGGQMPLQKRVPKYGFKNFNRVEYKVVNLDLLENIAQKSGKNEIDPNVLADNGIIQKNDLIKILGGGELSSKLTVKANAFSASAKKAIEDKGGKTEKL